MPYTIPFYAYTTERFGVLRSNGTRHRGHDVAPGGQDFPSWVNGTVVVAGWQACLGNRVVVKNSADGYYIGVSHLANIKVSVGQRVFIGTPLGNIGATGSCQLGRHAHITVSSSSAYPESGAVQDPVAYANNAGGSTPSGINYGYGLSNEAQKALQQAMTHVNRYSGPIDGLFGGTSVKGMQQWLKDMAYLPSTYAVDGIPGPSYAKALQTLAHKKSNYMGPIDGVIGPATSSALVLWAAAVMDTGSGSSEGYAYGLTEAAQKAIQGALSRLNLYDGVVDGVFGPRSVASMQTYLKQNGYLPSTYSVDGEPGVLYGKAMQTLAQKYGYSGPIDGVIGDMTSTALTKWASAQVAPTPEPEPTPTPTNRWPSTGSFGIDVASPQRDLDFARAKADGAKFAIIKMGGLNVTPQYVAPYYKIQVDRARAAGLKIGHYYLIGLGQNPEQQALFFVNNLYDFRPQEDILAIDNERLDGNGAFFIDDAAARFIREVKRLTGVLTADARWHYAGAYDYRNNAPWSSLVAEDPRFWWAAYGANNGTRDHEPSLQGSIPTYDVHQFSSMVEIAGYKLDGNWSPHSIDQLFRQWAVETEPEPEPTPEPDLDAVIANVAHAMTDLNTALGELRP